MKCPVCDTESTPLGASHQCPRCGTPLDGAVPVPTASEWPEYDTATSSDPPDAGRPRGSANGRSRLGRGIGAVGVAALLVVAVFVIRGMNGTSAGATSPDDLVQRLSDAMTGVDPAAAIALLDPGEVPGLGSLYQTAVTQARKGADIDVPGALRALTISVDDVKFRVDYLDSAQRYAKVSFEQGRLSYATHPEKLPDGVARRLQDDGGRGPEPTSDSADMADLRVTSMDGKVIDPFLVLVKENGRWYISIAMTVGEYAVETMDLPAGRFDDTPRPGPPASSPTDAVKSVLDAAISEANTGNSGGPSLTGLLPEAETRAFRVYGKSFASGFGTFLGSSADIQSSESSAGQDGTVTSGGSDVPGGPDPSEGAPFEGLSAQCDGCGASYRDLSVSTRRNGDLTYAVIDSLKVDVKSQFCYGSVEIEGGVDGDGHTIEGFQGHPANRPGNAVESGNGDVAPDPSMCPTETDSFSWNGRCIEWGSTYDPAANASAPDSGRGCLTDMLGDSGISLADLGITDAHLVMRQERGGWVIDPVATVVDYGRTAVSHLTDPKVEHAIDDTH